MQDVLSMASQLRRPPLMIRAARIGAENYRRDRHLPRVLGYGHAPRPAEAVIQLIQEETVLNDLRLSNDASYSLNRHVDVLIALVAETRVLHASKDIRAIPT